MAVDALAGMRPLTQLAAAVRVSRTFVYPPADRAEPALTAAVVPAPPADRVRFPLPVTAGGRPRLIGALLLVCHSSDRGVAELLRDRLHGRRSLGYLHGVAHAAREWARAHTGRPAWAAVTRGAQDAIVQTRPPLLVGGDGASTYGYLLNQEEQRDGDTGGLRLLELQAQGLAPRATIGAGGRGLVAGQELALPQVPRRRDVCHVVQELLAVVTALENRASQALTASVKLERRQAPSAGPRGRRAARVRHQLRYARPAAAAAAAWAADGATWVGWLRQDIVAVAGPGHAERVALSDCVIAELRARVPPCPQRLKPLCTDLANQRDTVVAFAQQRDAALGVGAVDVHVSAAVGRAVVAVHEMDVPNPRRGPRAAARREQWRGRF